MLELVDKKIKGMVVFHILKSRDIEDIVTQTEFLRWKAQCEMKNTLDGINGRLGNTE